MCIRDSRSTVHVPPSIPSIKIFSIESIALSQTFIYNSDRLIYCQVLRRFLIDIKKNLLAKGRKRLLPVKRIYPIHAEPVHSRTARIISVIKDLGIWSAGNRSESSCNKSFTDGSLRKFPDWTWDNISPSVLYPIYQQK